MLQKSRQSIIGDVVFTIGSRLRQSVLTQHLAVKLFDIVCLAHQSLDPCDPKNEPKNLKVLAGQCLLLASKYNEIQRLYPAELAQMVTEWGESEFDTLRLG